MCKIIIRNENCEFITNYIVDSEKTIYKSGFINMTIQKNILNNKYNYKINKKINNDGLLILKYLEIYRFVRKKSALLEKYLIYHNLYLKAKINKLSKEINYSIDYIADII